MSIKVKDNDFVSADRDWRSLISNELNGAKQWEEDWGFLSSGNALINDSIEAKIQKLESVIFTQKLKESNEAGLKTTSQIYGRGKDLEIYQIRENNIVKNKDLQSCDRKPKSKKK